MQNEQQSNMLSKFVGLWKNGILITSTLIQRLNKLDLTLPKITTLQQLMLKNHNMDGIARNAGIVDNDLLYVDQKCKHSLMSLDQYQWIKSKSSKRKAKTQYGITHMADALRYALYSFETSVTSFNFRNSK